MTTRSINYQVFTIKSATEKASSSKEAALAFLSAAGIIAKIVSRKAKTGESQPSEDKAGWRVAVGVKSGQSVAVQGKQHVVPRPGQFATRSQAVAGAKRAAGQQAGKRQSSSKK